MRYAREAAPITGSALTTQSSSRTIISLLLEASRMPCGVPAGHLVKIEVEVDNLDQLDEALAEGVDAVLLDNMSLEALANAVAMARGRALTEASGGITLEAAPSIAATGVDLISAGWLTHSAPHLDIGLD